MIKRTGAGVLAIVISAGMLGGCGGVGDALGINKYPPDEFTVVAKTPLVIPPDYNLRPPGANRPRPQEADPSQMAITALFPDANTQMAEPSSSEEQLLRASGGTSADRTVRSDLSPDTSVVRKGTFTEEILYNEDLEGGSGTLIERQTPSATEIDN
ncbi:MAG: DUF3035 domain-containing protein [Alphaproteobacteria bacterium]